MECEALPLAYVKHCRCHWRTSNTAAATGVHQTLPLLLCCYHHAQVVPRPNSAAMPRPDAVSAARERLQLRLNMYALAERTVVGDGNCQVRTRTTAQAPGALHDCLGCTAAQDLGCAAHHCGTAALRCHSFELLQTNCGRDRTGTQRCVAVSCTSSQPTMRDTGTMCRATMALISGTHRLTPDLGSGPGPALHCVPPSSALHAASLHLTRAAAKTPQSNEPTRHLGRPPHTASSR